MAACLSEVDTRRLPDNVSGTDGEDEFYVQEIKRKAGVADLRYKDGFVVTVQLSRLHYLPQEEIVELH